MDNTAELIAGWSSTVEIANQAAKMSTRELNREIDRLITVCLEEKDEAVNANARLRAKEYARIVIRRGITCER